MTCENYLRALTCMPICECGFNFAKGHGTEHPIESYPAVRNRDWLKLTLKERGILAERNPHQRWR